MSSILERDDFTIEILTRLSYKFELLENIYCRRKGAVLHGI